LNTRDIWPSLWRVPRAAPSLPIFPIQIPSIRGQMRELMQRGAQLMITSALAFSVMTVFVKLAGERLPSQEIVVARA